MTQSRTDADDAPSSSVGAISHDALRRLAGGRAYERGIGYVEAGAVGPLVRDGDSVEADVTGSRVYRVRLCWSADGLDYSCTCPVGDDGACCKHVVALGVATLSPDPRRRRKPQRQPRATTDADIRRHLEASSKSDLIAMLMAEVQTNEPLRRRLATDAASSPGHRVNLATFRKAFDEATAIHGFISYSEMYGFAKDVDQMIDSVERLLGGGHAAEAVELSEYGLAAIERAMHSVDDSGGQLGDLLQRLQDVHHAACLKARPDAATLAMRLFAWELRTDWDTFFHAARTYADVLGAEGLRAYRKAAEAVWAKVPPLPPGSRASAEFAGRFRITSIMEALARQDGDVEALVAIKQRDLSMPYSFLAIAEIYRQAGERGQALEWAERGLKAFSNERPDYRLNEFLAEEYAHHGRHADAVPVIWQVFESSLQVEWYQKLKQFADNEGTWPAWRERAQTHLRDLAPASGHRAVVERPRAVFARRADRSALVRALLWEKDPEAAWIEAKSGGCSEGLWLELAALREQEHPEDALPIYQREVENLLLRKNNDAYRDAVRMLRKIRPVMAAAGDESQFGRYLASLRSKHKAKRNFMKLLDHARW